MKTHPLLPLLLAALAPAFFARAADTPVDANILPGTNSVQTLWNATPGRTYRLQYTTNLTVPWRDALPAPGTVIAATNVLSQPFPTDLLAKFFRVDRKSTRLNSSHG